MANPLKDSLRDPAALEFIQQVAFIKDKRQEQEFLKPFTFLFIFVRSSSSGPLIIESKRDP